MYNGMRTLETGIDCKPTRIRCANCDDPDDHYLYDGELYYAKTGPAGPFWWCRTCKTVYRSPFEYSEPFGVRIDSINCGTIVIHAAH